MKKSEFPNNPEQMLKLWERLELTLNRGDEQSRYVTRIEDLSGNALVIEKPVRISGRLDILSGDRVEVAFGRDDALYTFDAVIVSIDGDRENIMTMQAVTELKRSQRRKFVRLDIAGDVTFKSIDKDDSGEMELSLDSKGELLNISAGGILISTGAKLKKGNLVLLNFRLKGNQSLENIIGLVKRWEQEGDLSDGEPEYLAGIEFLSKTETGKKLPPELLNSLSGNINFFDEALQQAIVQFVYKQQVEQRKKTKVNA